MAEGLRGNETTFRNTLWRPSRRALAVGWLLLLAFWVLIVARSVATGQLSGLLLPAVLATFGVVLVEVGYAGSVLLLGALFGPVEIALAPSGLTLRYDTPTGRSERVVAWGAIQRAEWATLASGEVRMVFRGLRRGDRLIPVDSRAALPKALRHFLGPDVLVEVDLPAPA